MMMASSSEEPAIPNGVAAPLLCDRCKTLDLSVEKFIIGALPVPVVPVSETPEAIKLDRPKIQPKIQPKSGNRRENFARLDQLGASRDVCNFCNLLWNAIHQYSHKNARDETTCSLTWEVDGRQNEVEGSVRPIYVNTTRRIRVSWRETIDRTQELHVVFVAPTDPERPNSDASAIWAENVHFLGREFGDQKEKQALIKSWLDICTENHRDACRDRHGTEREFKKLIRETYFGVIDVADMQLKGLPMENGKPARYVALSYVWGQSPHDAAPYRTTRANVMTHILHGGLEAAWDKLPMTLQDAILLVSRLGERYLWIDSLCIVQDSDSSWRLNAKAMHLVYGNAYFTICAADGDATTGLSAVNASLRYGHMIQPLSSGGQSAQPRALDRLLGKPTWSQKSVECAPNLRLMTTRSLETVINDSAWNKRAWTFQERILSRRCLVFAEGRVYFQCRSTGFTQDIYADFRGGGWSLDRTNSPHRTLKELQQRPLWFYMKYVSMYTGRSLTKARDILAAFEGITWLLGRYMRASSLFGIPTSHFDLCLLWMPQGAVCRRKAEDTVEAKDSKCTQDAMGNCTCRRGAESFGGDEFPSWAWSGWMGGSAGYDAEMIEGCLLNVREWLKYHTWIQWHIRDTKGHLRPLWEFLFRYSRGTNMYQREGSRSESRPGGFEDEDRWMGYPTESRDIEYRVTTDRQDSRDYYDHRRREERVVRIQSPPPERLRPAKADHDGDSSDSNDTDPRLERVSNKAYIRRRARSYAREESTPRLRRDSTPAVPSIQRGSSLPVTVDSVDSEDNERLSYSPHSDGYGRLIRSEIPQDRPQFQSILPDNPFGVIRENYYPQHPSEVTHTPILQFFTWSVDLYVSVREPTSPETHSDKSDARLCYCDIVDKEGDWCGSIMLPWLWARQREGTLLRFIAVSDAKSFTIQECPVWTYYVPKERDESEWDLYFTLLLERNAERGVWERAGLGKVFQAAFREKTWQEIKLG